MRKSDDVLRKELRQLVRDLRRQARADRAQMRKECRAHMVTLYLGLAEAAEIAANAIDLVVGR